MSNLIQHALVEFRAAGWTDDNGNFNDEMQELICKHVLELLTVFSNEGHSGTSAPYTIDLFSKLAMFEPIVPITGEDWEWADVSGFWADVSGVADEPMWQNKRCSHVFKNQNGAYDINGIVWWEWCTTEDGEMIKSYFTNRDSRVPVTFPYVPKQEYVFRPTDKFPNEEII